MTKEQLEIREKWVKALRSGKYQQGQRYLKQRLDEKTVAFCCLGVLCDILDVPSQMGTLSSTVFEYDQIFNQILPPHVIKKAGLRSAEGHYGKNGSSLSILNDTGYDFDCIANIIETRSDLFV
jgi:hypothetical protein